MVVKSNVEEVLGCNGQSRQQVSRGSKARGIRYTPYVYSSCPDIVECGEKSWSNEPETNARMQSRNLILVRVVITAAHSSRLQEKRQSALLCPHARLQAVFLRFRSPGGVLVGGSQLNPGAFVGSLEKPADLEISNNAPPEKQETFTSTAWLSPR